MKQLMREDVYRLFYAECELNMIDDIKRRKLYGENLSRFVDNLYDLSKEEIDELTSEELYILRKRYGVFDNGQSQNFVTIGKSLGISRQRAMIKFNDILNKKVVRSIKSIDYILKDINSQKAKAATISYLESFTIDELCISFVTAKRLNRAGIVTIKNLTSLTIQQLYNIKCVGKARVIEIIESVHKCGLRFSDEVIDFNVGTSNFTEGNNRNSFKVPLEKINLSTRTINILTKLGIKTLEEIPKLELNQFFYFEGMGELGTLEVLEKFSALGVRIVKENEKYCFSLKNSDENLTLRKTEDPRLLKLPIEALGMSVRATNALRKGGFLKLQDINCLSASSLASIKGMGLKTVVEVMEKIDSYGVYNALVSTSDNIEFPISELKERELSLLEHYASLERELLELRQREIELNKEKEQIVSKLGSVAKVSVDGEISKTKKRTVRRTTNVGTTN